MAMQSFTVWIRHPGSILLIITVVLMFVVMNEQSRQSASNIPTAFQTSSVSATAGSVPTLPVVSSIPEGGRAKMGNELPSIVRQFSAPSSRPAAVKPPGRLQAPDLGSLLGRLEDKVKSDPENIGNRLLLAQTYNELGLGDKGLDEVRAALVQAPDHARAQLVLASILSARQNEQGLSEAKMLLGRLKGNADVKQYMVAMYLGDALIRLGDRDAAIKNWTVALEKMPVTDNRRAQIEKRISEITNDSPDV
ncbi:MAG: hypothetical protein COB30_004745 [Ectothiorhodospiraceae bacterium]|nr:hypothetical protein [Ectothiorhodospiraceae bacterium]